MCGIVGHIGKAPLKKFLLAGLSRLQYRGYDSAGIAFLDNDLHFKVYKQVGTVDDLASILPSFQSCLGIGHTRWATNGLPNSKNAHPQVSEHGKVTLVHNGIIENHASIRSLLLKDGYHFHSSTDTEVIANFLERKLEKDHASPLEAIKSLFLCLEGSFALAILIDGEPNRLYFAKSTSPLVLGKGVDGKYLASDPAALVGYANEFLDLLDGDYGYLSDDEVVLCRGGEERKAIFVTKDLEHYEIDLKGYEHFMIKEIEEQPALVRRYSEKPPVIPSSAIEYVRNANRIYFLACGSSYHASLVGVRICRSFGVDAEALEATEFNVDPFFPKDKNSLFILLSQSGETIDTIDSFHLLKEKGYPVISITNSPSSNLARNADTHLYLECGVEVAVAATKTYAAEVCLLFLLFSLSFHKDPFPFLKEAAESLEELRKSKKKFSYLAPAILRAGNLFFIGRAEGYDAALECALKVKEVAGISCQGFPSGEFKHGPIALIKKGTPVFAFIGDKGEKLIRVNVEEIRNRGGEVSVVSSSPSDEIYILHNRSPLSVLSFTMIGQYLAYYLALELGKPCDRPQNLAKSVTVR